MGRSIYERAKVVGPAFAVGAGLSALAALQGGGKMGWGLGDTGTVAASVMAGPFSGLWAAHDWGMPDALGWAAAFGLAIAAHPLWSGWRTWAASAGGVGLWVLLGFALTYDGV